MHRHSLDQHYNYSPYDGPSGSACPSVSDIKTWETRNGFIFLLNFAFEQVLMNNLGNGAESHEAAGNKWQT